MHHTIKIEPAYFEAVLSGQKTFEVRFNDRGYNAGDTVTLVEFDSSQRSRRPGETVDARVTGRSMDKVITYVTGYGQRENWVVFSIAHKDDK